MKILIIGGSGHVSGAITRRALHDGHEVYNVTRGIKSLYPDVTSLIVDRHNLTDMKRVIAEQNIVWDLVIDCICYTPDDMKQDVELFKERTKQFILISTDFVYHPDYRKFPQDVDDAHYVTTGDYEYDTNDDNPFAYGARKRLCENQLIAGDMGDVKWTICRPCHIYGPTSELGCLPMHGRDPELIQKIRENKPIELVDAGYLLQQPIFVDDLAKLTLSILGNVNGYNQIFNVAGPDIIESKAYYQIIADYLGVELNITEYPIQKYLNDFPGQHSFICHRIYDLTSLKEANLAIPSTSIEEGLKLHIKGLLNRT